MLEQIAEREERRSERETRIRYGLVAVLLLAVTGFVGWSALEALGWWRVPLFVLGYGACAAVLVWWYRTRDDKLRNIVSDNVFLALLATIWGPGAWRGAVLIGPWHSLAIAGLTLTLWLGLWAKSRSWGALGLLPGAAVLAVTGYICAGLLTGHTIFAELMHPVMAGLLCVFSLAAYGFFAFRIWFAKSRATDKLQES
ncbi:hypothetical protein ABAC460_16330 [Asticcacaulis sp. AC460]|uniref:hypothetical protein n=1 Tax=Asticcacaulis sp. AC460 TaxID=1282360 RepID=UPI0003C3D5D9|nr:hypothetical protein [Asticcacaulis sp. AC460]ESQ88228.1 hypothetical protein ABAC460_16330 [Asticcacaulis sp. AC460]